MSIPRSIEESGRIVVAVHGAFVQHAGGLVRAPVGVDVGSMLEQKRRDLEVTVHAGPGERHVEHVLHPGRTPVKIGAPVRIVRRVVPIEVAQRRLSRSVEPALDAGEVAHAGGMRQIIGQRPDAREQRNEMGVSVLEARSQAHSMVAEWDPGASREHDRAGER